MEEVLKVNYDTEQPTVSERDLHEALDKCEDLSEFFVSCSKMKVGFNRENLKTLLSYGASRDKIPDIVYYSFHELMHNL